MRAIRSLPALAAAGLVAAGSPVSAASSPAAPLAPERRTDQLVEARLKERGLQPNARQRRSRENREAHQAFPTVAATMARASEREFPAPRDHFLREFGQSDREEIEQAADHASVPQALHLLNGTIIDALTNRYADFGRRIDAAGSPEEKIRMIFQAMLTRQPTGRELALARDEVAARGGDASEGIVRAPLNTRQFLFVP